MRVDEITKPVPFGQYSAIFVSCLRFVNISLSCALLLLLKVNKNKPSEFISRTKIALEVMARRSAKMDLVCNSIPIVLFLLSMVSFYKIQFF